MVSVTNGLEIVGSGESVPETNPGLGGVFGGSKWLSFLSDGDAPGFVRFAALNSRLPSTCPSPVCAVNSALRLLLATFRPSRSIDAGGVLVDEVTRSRM